MATLSVDNWALHELTLDFADQFVPDTLIANAADAKGRGINLFVTKDGQPLSMSNMKVYLLWRHDQKGTQGQTQFTAVNTTNGNYKVYYPAGMMYEGTVTARISIYVGNTTPITGSRDFRINVERNPINEGDAMASDDFSAFIQATIDLNELKDDLIAAAQSGEFDGKSAVIKSATATVDGTSGTPTVGVTLGGTELERTFAFQFSGIKGQQGNQGERGEAGPQGIQGETGPQGATGPAGADGTSCTHSWNGSTLTVTSASGTSSADLKGPQGPQGPKGDTGSSYGLSINGHTISLVENGSNKSVTVPDDDTTYQPATQSADGLMSSDDKAKLDAMAGYFAYDTVGNVEYLSFVEEE